MILAPPLADLAECGECLGLRDNQIDALLDLKAVIGCAEDLGGSG